MKKVTYNLLKIVVFLIITASVFLCFYKLKIAPYLPKYMETVYRNTNEAISKQSVDIIKDEVAFIYTKVQNVSDNQQLKTIFESFKQDNDYFWLLKSDLSFIYHPLENYINQLGIENFKDHNGFSFFQEILMYALSKGEGAVFYLSENPAKTLEVKVVYAKYFEKEGFIIGKSKSVLFLNNNPIQKNQLKYLFLIISVPILISLISGLLVVSLITFLIPRLFKNKMVNKTIFENTDSLIENQNIETVENLSLDVINENITLPNDIDKPFEPKIVGFLCNWCSYAGADKAGSAQKMYPPNVRIVKVMCSGRVDPEFVLKAFQEGADGVMILACHPGDCHYKEGNYRAAQRYQILKKLLNQYGIEEERCYFDYVSAGEGEKFVKIIIETVNRVKSLGPLNI